MEKDFDKILEKARQVSLSYDEKDAIRHRVKTTIGLEDAVIFSRLRFFNLKFAGVALGMFIMIGASVSWASENTLPGNPLYVVKTFNEKISGLLTLNPEASADWQVELADRRLEETEKLSNRGKLNENTRASLEFRFETSANQFNKEIKTLKSENKLRQAVELTSKLESVIERRRKIFSNIVDNEKMNGANSEMNVILNKVNLRSERLLDQKHEIEDEIENAAQLNEKANL